MKSTATRHTLLLAFLLMLQQLANGQSANFSWVNQIGGMGVEYGQSISTDAAGNVYTCGFFDGTVDIDPGPGTLSFTSQGLNDIFIQKVNPNGMLLWAKQIGGAGDDVSYMLTLNNAGEVVLTGYFSSTVDFDPGPGIHTAVSNGSTDIYILKLDSNGQFVWVKTIGGAFDDGANAVSADLNGTIYCTGYFDNTVNFNPSSANAINLTSQGLDDVFFMKLSSAGNVKWAKSIGNSNYQAGNGIVANALGDIYISGFYYNTLDCDPGPSVFNIANNGLTDIFIEKVDSSGNFSWVKQIGGAGFESPLALQLDATGNICHAGFFQQSIDFDPGIGTFNLSSNGGSDAYFEKLTPAGQFMYAKSFGGLLWDEINSISLDTFGNSYSTGFFQDTIDFDSGASIAKFASNGVRDIFVHKMDSAGTFIWAKQMGGSGDDWGNGIKVDLAGNVFTTGFFANLVDFNPGAGVANKLAFNDDAFVQKLQPCSPSYHTINATNCANFLLNNQTFYQSGTYTQFKTNYLGCDSIITLNLTIVPASFTTIQQTICNGTSYFFNNQNLTQSGNYKDTLLNYRNCDSILLLQLQVLSPIITSIPVSICAGNNYLFNGQILQNSGSYYDTLTAYSNCDSIIQLQLNVLPHSTYSFSNTNCFEQSFLFNGHLINSSGLFYDTLSNYLNCDSLITLNNLQLPRTDTIFKISICNNSTYNFNGTLLTASGTYHDTLTNHFGCDSIVNLDLTILTPITLVISGYVCYGQATTGYQDTIFSSLGCDSIIYNYIYQALAPIDTSVTYINSWMLQANAIGFPAYTYQWLYSYYANGSLSTFIAGSTSDTLMPMGYGYGYYAVIISDTFHHCSDTSSWYGFFCQGIKSFNKKVDFQLYPNPTTNYCTLKISQPGTYQVQLHDNLAQLLHTFYPATPNGMYKLALDNYPKGLYWLMVKEVYTGLVSWKQVIID